MTSKRSLRSLIAGCLAMLLLSPGCDKDVAPPIRLNADGVVLEVQRDPFTLRLYGPDGALRTEVAPGGFGVARVAIFDAGQSYDPVLTYYDPIDGPHEPDGLTWAHVVRVTRDAPAPGEPGGRDLTVRLSDGTEATLHIGLAAPNPDFAATPVAGTFRLTLDVPSAGLEIPDEPAVVWTFLTLSAPAGENYYGLGEVFHSLAHRGQTVAMQMEIAEMEGFSNEAHVRIPFLVATGGWGVFADTKRPGFFDVADSSPDAVRLVFHDAQLPLYLMASDDPARLPERYVSLTGKPALPPIWAFAPIQWRNEVSGQAMVLEDASAIRENDLPTGAIWIDRPYQSGYNTMDFDPARYPDATAMTATLHEQGFRLAAWNTPYLEDSDPDHPRAEAEGWFVRGPFVFHDFGDLLDLTNPDAMAFWQGRVAAARDRGIEGWKLDYAEDIQIGLGDTRLQFSFANGEDERTMNREYATYYHQAYAEPLGLPEVFTLVRAGTVGGQRYASVVWPGDLCSDFREFGDTDAEGTVHVGGLPSAVRAGTGLAVSGYPFFASDTGGFRHQRPTAEVMIRWTEYSALLPIMQYGGGGVNHNPWDLTDYGESHFTPETLEQFRRYALLHIRLFPYFYTLAQAAHDTGAPPVLPFGLAYPADGRHPEDVFLSGPDLLVAPLWKGGTSRTVPLPEGQWIDWWTGEAHHGPAELDVTAPLGTLPLYLRAGAIVPMLRPSVRTLSPVGDPSIDSYDTDPGRLWGRVVPPPPDAATDRTLHDGTGLAVATSTTGDVHLTYTPGAAYAGLRLSIYAPNVTTVDRDGAALHPANNESELDTCSACTFRSAGSPWLALALAADQTAATTTFTLR